MSRTGVARLTLLALVLSVPMAARAHPLDTSLTGIRIDADKLVLTFSFNLRELQDVFHLDANGDRVLTRDELLRKGSAMQKFIAENVALTFSYTPESLGEPRPFELPKDWDDLPERMWPYQQVQFVFERALKNLPSAIWLRVDYCARFGPKHTNIVVIAQGQRREEFILRAQQPKLRYDTGRALSLPSQMVEFVKLGIEHILTGYDHLLFLLALIVVGANFWQLLKIVTSFTVAHSITLLLAAFNVVTLPSRLIESSIALTIVYVAAENLWAKKTSHRWVLTFFFGLIHGFGFANALRELELPTRGLVASLLSFNAGVEIGQLCVVAILFPAILWLNQQPFAKKADRAVSLVVLALGAAWFVERALGRPFMPF